MTHFRYPLVAGLLSGALGCPQSSIFECGSDSSCDAHGVPGICQPSGYCSFGDPICDSGQRYGEHAPEHLAEHCVPLWGSEPSTGASSDPASTGRSTESGGPELEPSTSEATGSSTDPANPSFDDGTTGFSSAAEVGETSVGETSAGETSAGETSVGETGLPACPSFADDFEDGVIGAQWNVSNPPDSEEVGGQLKMTQTPAVTTDATGIQLFNLDLSQATLDFELGIMPVHFASQLMLAVEGEDEELATFVLQPGNLYLRHGYLGMTKDNLLGLPFDPVDHQWLRFAIDDPEVTFQASSDGVSWSTLLDFELDAPLGQSRLHILATNWAAMSSPETVSIETFRMCN